MPVQLNEKFFQELLSQADKSPRMRSHYTLHIDVNESVQRLCVGLKKGTYVRPHHHPQSNKWELLIVLKGSITLVIFNNEGIVLKRLELGPRESLGGIEIEPGIWHTVFPVSEDAVFLEVKEGPYIPTTRVDYATWAPAEGHADVPIFQKWLEAAQKGEKYTK